MLDPRIYRAGLIAVALAVVVFAFSLQDQPAPASSTLAPDAFNGQNAYNDMTSLARRYPDRRPGSVEDGELAAVLAARFRQDHLTVGTDTFTASTADGVRTLETVTGTSTGQENGTIVVVAHRDALASPATTGLSGTGVLLDLGRVLSGETLKHSVILASTSGSVGAAGAERLARQLAGQADAVIVLGDMTGSQIRQPTVVPWSDGRDVAPMLLRNTLATALHAQTAVSAGGTSTFGQLVHLAFPLTVSEQGPFGAYGEPAALLSSAGERGPSPFEPYRGAPPRLAVWGAAVLQAINALDSVGTVSAPSAYLLFAGKVIPAWAIRMLALALLLPVLGATIDGLARVRRRGHAVWPWALWVLAGAAPFGLALAVVPAARVSGLLVTSPPSPVAPGTVPLHAAGIAVLAGLGFVLALGFGLVRPAVAAAARRAASAREHPGRVAPCNPAAAALLLVMCALALLIWVSNPFAALLIVPTLHVWMLAVGFDLRLHPVLRLALVAIGIAPVAGAVVYYLVTLGYGAVGLLWTGVLMIAGGQIGPLAALEWAVAFGCLVSVAVIAARTKRAPVAAAAEVPITVRGPITYAGPGSLGGTESALRR